MFSRLNSRSSFYLQFSCNISSRK